jgi:hypothetical protein
MIGHLGQLSRGDSFTYVQELLFAPLQRERFLLKLSLLYSSGFFHLIMVSNPGYFFWDIADWFTTSQTRRFDTTNMKRVTDFGEAAVINLPQPNTSAGST